MPTLTNTEPDSYDIDYFYGKYKDRFGVGMSELKEESLRVLPLGVQPTACEVNNLKKQHYFK
ncbi:7790_t:CDS:1, partial [Scutellospora calospora]